MYEWLQVNSQTSKSSGHFNPGDRASAPNGQKGEWVDTRSQYWIRYLLPERQSNSRFQAAKLES
jgi:hypothetical protein